METFTNANGDVVSRGQVDPDSPFGRALTVEAIQAETIVEIGTWFGLGSTKALADGLVRPSQHLYTVEVDPGRSAEAQARYHDNRITFLVGRGVEVSDCLPIRIDLLLLDGADEESDAEFDLYHARAKVIALDDVLMRKNARQLEILQRWHWKMTAGSSVERHGWAIMQAWPIEMVVMTDLDPWSCQNGGEDRGCWHYRLEGMSRALYDAYQRERQGWPEKGEDGTPELSKQQVIGLLSAAAIKLVCGG